jgi:REP-associated tyrosine transposase
LLSFPELFIIRNRRVGRIGNPAYEFCGCREVGRIGNPAYTQHCKFEESPMTSATWNLAPPPGFRDLDPNRPLTFYQRHLRHWRQDGASYFVTFRLADSLPQAKRHELAQYKQDWGRTHPPPRSDKDLDELAKELFVRVEGTLDQGFRPLQPDIQPLEKILQGRKRITAQKINETLRTQGTLRQEQSFDRIIRDEEHLYRCIQYIGNNPRKAKLPPNEWQRWIRPQWKNLGWGFADETA